MIESIQNSMKVKLLFQYEQVTNESLILYFSIDFYLKAISNFGLTINFLG